MRRSAIIVSACILFSLSAQTSVMCASNWYLGLAAGPEFLTSDSADVVDDAVAFGVYGGYRLDRRLSLEAAFTTASHDVDLGGDLTISSILFGPRFSAQVDRNLVLYGGVGFGIYPIEYEHGSYDDSETETGLYLGAGMEFPLKGNMRIGIDLKYHTLFDDDTLDSDIVTLLLRLGFDL